MCVNLKRDICLFFPPPPLEERQKKKRQHREKSSEEGKTSLKRSKTFVNLLFKKDRKERSRSKSPSRRANKGERAVTGCGFFFHIVQPAKWNVASDFEQIVEHDSEVVKLTNYNTQCLILRPHF